MANDDIERYAAIMVNEIIYEDEIWADLDRVFSLQERQPGDIDADQLAARYQISTNAALRRMNKMAESGEYVTLFIRDDSSGIGKRKVLRKVK